MLQPLWESRDRYEELKQMDDAMTEVGPRGTAGDAGFVHTAGTASSPSGRALVPTQRRGRPTTSGALMWLEVT